jgi:hypothetical protein
MRLAGGLYPMLELVQRSIASFLTVRAGSKKLMD